MLRSSAYKLRIRTDSADSEGILLLADGELVAILIKLADESHEQDRGKWVIETLFGINPLNPPALFDTADHAAAWVSQHVSQTAYALDASSVQLH
jgi:hypothetical protein